MLRDDFIDVILLLSKVTNDYEKKANDKSTIVGGSAASIYTVGRFNSGDVDIVVGNDEQFYKTMEKYGFIKENRKGFLHVGWFHPEHNNYGFQLVSAPLFDGNADDDKTFKFNVGSSYINLPSVEDMIADRLAQHEVSSVTDNSRLLQAQEMFKCMKDNINISYLDRRVQFESGDISLLNIEEGFKGNGESVREMNLFDYVQSVENIRKQEGFVETEESVDAKRNKGGNRTPEKIELLKSISDRSKDNNDKIKFNF